MGVSRAESLLAPGGYKSNAHRVDVVVDDGARRVTVTFTMTVGRGVVGVDDQVGAVHLYAQGVGPNSSAMTSNLMSARAAPLRLHAERRAGVSWHAALVDSAVPPSSRSRNVERRRRSFRGSLHQEIVRRSRA